MDKTDFTDKTNRIIKTLQDANEVANDFIERLHQEFSRPTEPEQAKRIADLEDENGKLRNALGPLGREAERISLLPTGTAWEPQITIDDCKKAQRVAAHRTKFPYGTKTLDSQIRRDQQRQIKEKAKRIAELEAENKRLDDRATSDRQRRVETMRENVSLLQDKVTLRKALQPFAANFRYISPQHRSQVYYDQLQAAAAAMESTSGESIPREEFTERKKVSPITRVSWRRQIERLTTQLQEAKAELDTCKSAIATPEIYVGVISKILEDENTKLHTEIIRLEAELTAPKQSEPVDHRVLDVITQNLHLGSIHFGRREKAVLFIDRKSDGVFAITVHRVNEPSEPTAEEPRDPHAELLDRFPKAEEEPEKLEWEIVQDEDGIFWKAKYPGCTNPQWEIWLIVVDGELVYKTTKGNHPTLSEAKAAVQAEHDRLVAEAAEGTDG